MDVCPEHQWQLLVCCHAREAGEAMLRAGWNKNNPDALMSCVVCIVPDGTPVTIFGRWAFSDDIVIAGGDEIAAALAT